MAVEQNLRGLLDYLDGADLDPENLEQRASEIVTRIEAETAQLVSGSLGKLQQVLYAPRVEAVREAAEQRNYPGLQQNLKYLAGRIEIDLIIGDYR